MNRDGNVSHTTYSSTLGFTFGPLLFRRCFSFIADVHEQPSSGHKAALGWGPGVTAERLSMEAFTKSSSHEMRLRDATLAPNDEAFKGSGGREVDSCQDLSWRTF